MSQSKIDVLEQKVLPAMVPNEEYADFVGDHPPDLALADPEKTLELVAKIKAGVPLEQILNTVFNKDRDNLARCATLAFHNQHISRIQLASILYFREMLEISKHCEQVFITDNLHPRMQKVIDYLVPQNLQAQFFDGLKNLPLSEQSCFVYEEDENIKHDTIIGGLYQMHQAYVDKPNHRRIVVFSLGAMELVSQLVYQNHAKKMMPRAGKFNIDDIDRSERAHGRYVVVEHPEIPSPPSFHGTPAKIFYNTVHDLVHLALISTIPDPIYFAYLHAIDLVRKKTGIRWDAGLWDGTDLAVVHFEKMNAEERDSVVVSVVTKNFCRMLVNHDKTDHNVPMLFKSESVCADTTLILMIDIFENHEGWLKFGINPGFFTPEYMEIFKFVRDNSQHLTDRNSAEQVAVLKSLLLKKEVMPTPEAKCAYEKQDRFIQVTVDGKNIGVSKAQYLAFQEYTTNLEQLKHSSSRIRGVRSILLNAVQTEVAFLEQTIDADPSAPSTRFFSKPQAKTVKELKSYAHILDLARELIAPHSFLSYEAKDKQFQEKMEEVEKNPTYSTDLLQAMQRFYEMVKIAPDDAENEYDYSYHY